MADLELGVIGNCEVAALIDRNGSYVWMCWPRPDGDPVFDSLINPAGRGRDGGYFSVDLVGRNDAKQVYERNTAVLQTVLSAADGAQIRITDFAPRFRDLNRTFRPAMMVRIIDRLRGNPVIRLRLRPEGDYGATKPHMSAGSNHVRVQSRDMVWRFSTDASVNAVLEERPIVLRERICIVIGNDEPLADSVAIECARYLDQTRIYWRDWVRSLAIPYEWQAEVIRAAITLKLCSFEDTGAVLAALTTSIPESAESGRNWDYRFCWLRDSYFTIQALNQLGATRTMEGYLRYIQNILAASDGIALQPVYSISGETDLAEHIADTLSGYRGMGPVRVGNQACRQVQHDVYGAVILASMQTFLDQRLNNPGDAESFSRLELAGERCWALYDQADSGPWEYRGRMRVHSFSSVMCLAGVERLARIARRLGLDDRTAYWGNRGAQMRERILSACWDPNLQCFTQTWGEPTVDATALLFAELGLVGADDSRFVRSVEFIGKFLRQGQYLFRYMSDDDFGKPSTAFNICTFWYVNALASIGRREEARALFDNMLQRCNGLGLLSEDIDPATGELWGNYPQTYSLVGIINSAMRLSCSWQDAL